MQSSLTFSKLLARDGNRVRLRRPELTVETNLGKEFRHAVQYLQIPNRLLSGQNRSDAALRCI